MKKSESKAWKLAKRISRRKGCMWVPVGLSECGTVVTVQSLIRGTQWEKTLASLELLVD